MRERERERAEKERKGVVEPEDRNGGERENGEENMIRSSGWVNFLRQTEVGWTFCRHAS